MRTISLVAVKDFTYNHRSYVAGEYFQATPIESAAHLYQKRAKFAAEPIASKDLKSETVDAPKSKRRYRRRDLQADD